MMLHADAAIAATFVLYLLGMLAVGVIACHRTRNLSDYILGGRRLGSFVTALSAQASDMSGWLLLGLPGAAYVSGLGSVWIAIGLLAGTYVNWLVVAPRLRVRTAEANDALTISEYLEHRFDDRSHLLRWVSGVFILVFFLIYTTSGLVAGGKLFESVFHIEYRLAVLAGAAAIISYTCLGGFGATFGPVLIMSLFWKGTTRNGALAGIVVGGITVLVWGKVQGGVFDLYEIVPGMVLSFAAIAFVSWLGKKGE